MADHNDPNAVNSIFSDIDVSAADRYDIIGFPSDDTAGGEKAVIALTFASVPQAGVLDPDLLYRVRIAPGRRIVRAAKEDQAVWDARPIEPKTPPNPLKNDKEFHKQFPYLAEPW